MGLSRPAPAEVGLGRCRSPVRYTSHGLTNHGEAARVRVLFFADVIGKPGRELLTRRLPELRERFAADAVIANGENATDGKGIRPKHADELLAAGVDVITTGNHIWRQRDIYRYLDEQPRIVRPYNFLSSNPGRGVTAVEHAAGRAGRGQLRAASSF